MLKSFAFQKLKIENGKWRIGVEKLLKSLFFIDFMVRVRGCAVDGMPDFCRGCWCLRHTIISKLFGVPTVYHRENAILELAHTKELHFLRSPHKQAQTLKFAPPKNLIFAEFKRGGFSSL